MNIYPILAYAHKVDGNDDIDDRFGEEHDCRNKRLRIHRLHLKIERISDIVSSCHAHSKENKQGVENDVTLSREEANADGKG